MAKTNGSTISEPVFTTGGVAKICKVSPAMVSKWCDQGRLRAYRIPGSEHRRIARSALIPFLKEHFPHCIAQLDERNTILVTTGWSCRELLEDARAHLADEGLLAEYVSGEPFYWGAAAAGMPNWLAVAIIVPAAADFPAGFPEPKDRDSNKNQLILFRGDPATWETKGKRLPVSVPTPPPAAYKAKIRQPLPPGPQELRFKAILGGRVEVIDLKDKR